ncbi:MAG: hypothetical protein WDA07_05530 [Leucobacter sp.]
MSGTYTPTMKNIEDCYVYSGENYDGSLRASERQLRAEFAAALAAHDAEVAAKTLEEAADLAEGVECIVLDPVMEKIGKNVGLSLAQELRARAAEYRKAVQS